MFEAPDFVVGICYICDRTIILSSQIKKLLARKKKIIVISNVRKLISFRGIFKPIVSYHQIQTLLE